jgi:hypothetical protein
MLLIHYAERSGRATNLESRPGTCKVGMAKAEVESLCFSQFNDYCG